MDRLLVVKLEPAVRIGISRKALYAEQHIAGLCLVNDWSARDIQAWE